MCTRNRLALPFVYYTLPYLLLHCRLAYKSPSQGLGADRQCGSARLPRATEAEEEAQKEAEQGGEDDPDSQGYVPPSLPPSPSGAHQM